MDLERNDDIPGTEPLLPERSSQRQKGLQEYIKNRLRSRNWHWFILCLVASDFFCVLTTITITFLWPEEEHGEMIETLSIIAFLINTVFVIEIFLNLFVFGNQYFSTGPHWFIHLFDALVVIATFLLEIFLKGKEREVAGLLIIFRLWRLIKILSAVAVGLGEYDEQKVEELEKKIEELEDELKSLLRTADQISKEDDWDESKRERDNAKRGFLQMDDRLLLYRGGDQEDLSTINPDTIVWQHIPVPIMYISDNWPIKYSSISGDGRYIAIAGRRGLAHYNVSSGRWKLFGNQQQEQEFAVRGGLLWFRQILVAACENVRSHTYESASIIFLIDGKLILLHPKRSDEGEVQYDLHVLADKIEFYWMSTRGIGSLKNSLWACDGQGLKTHLFLQHILRYMLTKELEEESVAFATSYQKLVYFGHALEMLLHLVLEEEAEHSAVGKAKLLPRVVKFLNNFPHALNAIVGCARKTEVALWDYLFSIVGSPKDLFEKCMSAGLLKTATSYLLVLHTLEPSTDSSKDTIRLLSKAMDSEDYENS
ncbi:2822_t:CDS:10 [Acaulospora colombiana]|uniref:2822_t:CDS:1 n=1 Tax=Acaulospora colombiana TaxID=27376 RepID=A0ACA9K7P8_9GLOM|nr:2822_t:CDS:10 [Acaulospora colombiana]